MKDGKIRLKILMKVFGYLEGHAMLRLKVERYFLNHLTKRFIFYKKTTSKRGFYNPKKNLHNFKKFFVIFVLVKNFQKSSVKFTVTMKSHSSSHNMKALASYLAVRKL